MNLCCRLTAVTERERRRLPRSRQENQRHHENHGGEGRWRLPRGTNDRVIPWEQFRSAACPAAAAAAFFCEQHSPGEANPPKEGSRSQALPVLLYNKHTRSLLTCYACFP